jgi:hypothetical protein
MPSSFTPNKVYELQATGENNGTWGIKADADFSIIDLNFGGRFNQSVAGNTNFTVSAGQAQNVRHVLTGVLTGNIQYIFPNTGGFYIVTNNTTGAFSLSVANAGGGSAIPLLQGTSGIFFINPDGPSAELIAGTASSGGGGTSLDYGGTAGGTANAPTIALPLTPTLGAGLRVSWTVASQNTGAATLNANATGVKNLTKYGATALVGGEMRAGMLAVAEYDGTQYQLLNPVLVQKLSVDVPAGSWRPRQSNGCIAATVLETTTNKVNRTVLGFINGSQTFAQCVIPLPKGYNGGTLSYRVTFESTVGSNAQVYGLQALFLRSGDTIDTAFGTAVNLTTTVGASTVEQISAESTPLTPGGTFAANCMLVLQLYRDGGAGGDSNTGQGNLWAVQLYYNTNTWDDA